MFKQTLFIFYVISIIISKKYYKISTICDYSSESLLIRRMVYIGPVCVGLLKIADNWIALQ